MADFIHQIRKCLNPSCGFRFHNHLNAEQWIYCPKCGASTDVIESPYESMLGQEFNNENLPVIEVLLDNIRSAYNVGSILRTSDGVHITHIHCCGITPTPDNAKVKKTSLGAEQNIPWTQYWDSIAAAKNLIEQGYLLVALEGGSNAISIFELINDPIAKPMALVVGNEVSGVDPGLLNLCHKKIWLPMLGNKHSFNVSVAFGIAAYLFRFSKEIL
jgi:23S rRNA (guanosine2251-2'-O)-methyltransferase